MHDTEIHTPKKDEAGVTSAGRVGGSKMEQPHCAEGVALGKALATLRARAALQRLVVYPLADDRYLVAATSNAWTCEVAGLTGLERLVGRVEGRR